MRERRGIDNVGIRGLFAIDQIARRLQPAMS